MCPHRPQLFNYTHAATVSSGIESQLRGLGFTVTRYGGVDRYQTAALINSAYFPAGSTSTGR